MPNFSLSKSKPLLFLFIILLTVCCWILVGEDHKILDKKILAFLENTTYKITLYFILCLLIAFITIPLGVITKVLGGYLFGFIPGFFISLLSILIGSYLGFLIARFSLKEILEVRYQKRLEEINENLNTGSILTVIRFRFFPYIPFQLLNYLLGLSKVSSKNFLIGSLIGMIPATLIYAWLGEQIKYQLKNEISYSTLIPVQLFLLGLFLMTFLFKRNSKILTIQNEVYPYFTKLLKNLPPRTWDEQAIPSYLHNKWIVRYTFWQRIKHALKIAPTGEMAIDFGCGAGAMIPSLAKNYKRVVGLDKDQRSIEACQKLCSDLNIKNVAVYSTEQFNSILEEQSVDTIFALDVLEHVDHLPALLIEFKKILKPNGIIVVSSPTENFIYKFARKFGGPGYQGEYHLRAAKEVEADLAQQFRVKLAKRIFPIFTFFRIVIAKN